MLDPSSVVTHLPTENTHMWRNLRAGSEKASSVCLANPESSPMGEGVHANLSSILRDHSRRNRTTRCRNTGTHTRSSPAVVRADVGGGDISRTRLGRRHGRGTSCAVLVRAARAPEKSMPMLSRDVTSSARTVKSVLESHTA
ncbi:hypothetical protein AcV7_008624 [Taiwanofungus camphoratus]|nr:hypothetical protein AcV7_008624 [Antrodia cinnamomea]